MPAPTSTHNRLDVRPPEADGASADIRDTLRLARTSMPALAAAAVLVTICFWDTPQGGAMLVMLACILLPVAGAFAAAFVFAERTLSAASVVRARGAASLFAFLIGCAWSAVPLTLFAASDHAHRLIVVATVGIVLAVVSMLGPIVAVSLLFGAPIVLGAVAAFALSGDAAAAPLAVLVIVYAGFLAVSRASLAAIETDRQGEPTLAGTDLDLGIPRRQADPDVAGSWHFELDERGRLRDVSEALATAVGASRAQLEGAAFKSLFIARLPNAQMTASARVLVDRVAARRAFNEAKIEMKTAGGTLWWRFAGKPVHNTNGGFAGHRGTCVDVTVTHDAEARIDFLTRYDALTGVVKRDTLLAKMDEACAAKDASRRALIVLDLDGFKMVNDGFGPAVADDVLKQVALRLSSLVPPNAIVARIGDDEFGVLSHVTSLAAAEGLARHLIEGFAVPFQTAGGAVPIGASAGVSVAPDHADTAITMLAKADLALRRAKADGRGEHRLFVAAYEVSLADRRLLEDDLKLALARREFTLHYQPIVDLISGRVSSFEALIRWNSPTRGAMPPVSFIPTAEATGLIVPLGRWVLAEACAEAARWDPTLVVAVNISPQQFRSPDFVHDVMSTLAASGLHASRLEIEITEGVLLDHSEIAIENLQALRRRGIRIALDDFGTGFSSLSYLVNFPVDKIKIDRSFVQGLVHRRESRVIVEAILTLAKQLSIRVTAEGVETIDQALALKMYRCDTIQGYLLSKPKPAAELEGLVKTIPKLFESMIPLDSPLALALAIKKQGGDQTLDRPAAARR